jgi:hypothetical protein
MVAVKTSLSMAVVGSGTVWKLGLKGDKIKSDSGSLRLLGCAQAWTVTSSVLICLLHNRLQPIGAEQEYMSLCTHRNKISFFKGVVGLHS